MMNEILKKDLRDVYVDLLMDYAKKNPNVVIVEADL